MTIATDPKRMGAKVGMTSVLHTWVVSKPGFFLHVRVLSRLFRCLIPEGLMALHQKGKFAFLGDLAGLSEPEAFVAWMAPCG